MRGPLESLQRRASGLEAHGARSASKKQAAGKTKPAKRVKASLGERNVIHCRGREVPRCSTRHIARRARAELGKPGGGSARKASRMSLAVGLEPCLRIADRLGSWSGELAKRLSSPPGGSIKALSDQLGTGVNVTGSLVTCTCKKKITEARETMWGRQGGSALVGRVKKDFGSRGTSEHIGSIGLSEFLEAVAPTLLREPNLLSYTS